MKRKVMLSLLAGAVLAIVAFGALPSIAATHCLGYCPDRLGYRYVGCTVYMDDQDDIVNVECEYESTGWNIAE